MIWKPHRWACSVVYSEELILYEFKLGHDAMEAAKNICCVKGQNAVIRCSKKSHLGCKNLDDQLGLKQLIFESML